jgi:PadR family transcriptional regulator, regulatory protein PadR
MPRDPTDLSSLEQLIMLAVLRLHPSGYGVSISDELERRTGKRAAIGSIYAALDRLEGRGFVASKMGEATAERGGKRKMYFTLTGLGRKALDASLSAIDQMRVPGGVQPCPV